MPHDVVFLTRRGCAGSGPMLERLVAALESLQVSTPPRVLDIAALPADDERRGYPTPTVLVDGRDLFGMDTPPAGQAPT